MKKDFFAGLERGHRITVDDDGTSLKFWNSTGDIYSFRLPDVGYGETVVILEQLINFANSALKLSGHSLTLIGAWDADRQLPIESCVSFERLRADCDEHEWTVEKYAFEYR